MDDKRDSALYVRQIQESTQQYTRELLKENERLASLVTAMHEEKGRLERTIAVLEDQLRDKAESESSLLVQIEQMKAISAKFTERYLDVEQLNMNLANLYVASYRIHGSLVREEVLATIKEVLVNLIGTEDFALFEGDDLGVLRCTTTFGVDPANVLPIRLGRGRIGEAIAKGVPSLIEPEPDTTPTEPPVTACIPLRVGERVVGAIVIYRLLSHKLGIDESDLELFNLLATHGATALYCSALHARRAQEACA